MSELGEYSVRLARKADLQKLMILEKQSFTDECFSQSQMKYLLTKANSLILVVEDKTNLLGSIILLKRRNSYSLRIYSLAVNPKYRGKGIGKKLLEITEEKAIQLGLKTLSLEVKSTNSAAISLYGNNGFIKTKEKNNYYTDGSAAYIMRKEIA